MSEEICTCNPRPAHDFDAEPGAAHVDFVDKAGRWHCVKLNGSLFKVDLVSADPEYLARNSAAKASFDARKALKDERAADRASALSLAETLQTRDLSLTEINTLLRLYLKPELKVKKP